MRRKRIVVFEVLSQGQVNKEVYEIRSPDNSEGIGRALIRWFNYTGGNNDGTYRKFLRVLHDITVNENEYIDYIESNNLKLFTPYRSIGNLDVLGSDYRYYLGEEYDEYEAED